MTSRVYEFRNHEIKEYLGDIDYYLEQRKLQDMRAVEKRDKAKVSKVRNDSSEKTSFSDQKEIKRLKNKLSKTEANITKIEKELKTKDKQLASNYEETVTKPDFLTNYNKSKKKLENLMEEWEEIQLEIEQIS